MIRSLAIAAALLALSSIASAQHKRSNIDQAGRIVSQPVRDVGLAKTKVPPVLTRAAQAPYATAGLSKCPAIRAQLRSLDAVLGPDLDRGGPRPETLAALGGKAVVNSLIPFRGVVREVSGAAAADRRKAIGIQAGLARRGFLRGLALARHC
ncbi:hypothetical protein [Sphingomonas sp.]|uniref:hypothetical protein n=1 Tax=Sphingomonas sp. TaxID=28214 RepID=UPI0025DF4C7E|nr:hypothetical protein [Sphingomonas sp.]